jgi:hypothetical protein
LSGDALLGYLAPLPALVVKLVDTLS